MTKLDKKIYAIETDIQIAVKAFSVEGCWVTHYGATEIDPKYLVYKVCVKSSSEKYKLQQNQQLIESLRTLLVKHHYPSKARAAVTISFDAQDCIDQASQGNAWHHWR